MRTLVIGGTGPTGPDVLAELLRRDHDVTILHRGVHEPADELVLDEVEHIHADPHFREPLEAAVTGRDFDLVVAMYGRMALNAEVFADRCDRFISVGGNPVHRGYLVARSAYPEGVQVLAGEDGPRTTSTETSRDRFAAKVAAAEDAVMAVHRAGGFSATHLRYPMIYSHRAKAAFERWAVRRLVEGERRLLLADSGLSIYTRAASRNAAHCIGIILDNPAAASGQTYHCADDQQYSLRQWTQLIARHLGVEVEIVGVPMQLARPIWATLPTGPLASPHTLLSTARIQALGYRDRVDPSAALGELVHRFAGDLAQTDEFAGDVEAERAVIAAIDALRASLGDQLGWDDRDDHDEMWHPYAHPKQPSSTSEPALNQEPMNGS